MKQRIIITEAQMSRLFENTIYSNMVKRIVNELDAKYSVVDSYFLEGGEYLNKPMIEVKIDGQIISPKTLFEYLMGKYSVNEEFIKQVIRDWVTGNIGEDYSLSSNISL